MIVSDEESKFLRVVAYDVGLDCSLLWPAACECICYKQWLRKYMRVLGFHLVILAFVMRKVRAKQPLPPERDMFKV